MKKFLIVKKFEVYADSEKEALEFMWEYCFDDKYDRFGNRDRVADTNDDVITEIDVVRCGAV